MHNIESGLWLINYTEYRNRKLISCQQNGTEKNMAGFSLSFIVIIVVKTIIIKNNWIMVIQIFYKDYVVYLLPDAYTVASK